MSAKDLTRLDLMLRQLVPSNGQERVRQTVNDLLTTVRQEVWQAAIDEALAFANEDLSNTNVLVLIEQHLKPRLEAAANSVPKDSEPEGEA